MSVRVSNEPQEEAGISEGDENVYDSKKEVLLYFHIPSGFFFVKPQLHIFIIIGGVICSLFYDKLTV